MKKLIYFVMMFISICLFTVQFDRFNMKLFYHYSEMYAPRIDDYQIINLSFSCKDHTRNPQDVVSVVREYAKKNQLDVTYFSSETLQGRKYLYRWADLNTASIPYDSLYVREHKTLSIPNHDGYYFTTNKNDKDGLHLMYLDKSYYNDLGKPIIYYLSFDDMSDLWEYRTSGGFFVHCPANSISYHMNQLQLQLQDVVDGIDLVDESMLYTPTEVEEGSLYLMTILGLIFLIILFLLYTFKQSQEFKIRIMHGQNDFHIYRSLYGKLVAKTSLISCLTFIVLYMINVQEIHLLGFYFLVPLCLLSLLSFFIFHAVCILFYLIIKFSMKFRLSIKLPFRILYFTSGFVRIVLIVLTLSQLITTIDVMNLNLSSMKRMKQNEDFYVDKIMLHRLGNMHLSTFTKENFTLYQRLNEIGAVYCDWSALYNDTNELAVNDNYIKNFLNVNFISELEKEKNKEIVFKHISQKNISSYTLYNENDAKVIYYDENITVPVLTLYVDGLPSMITNPILTVYRDLSKSSISSSLNGPEYVIPVSNPDSKEVLSDIKSYLSDLKLSQGLTIEPVHIIIENYYIGFYKNLVRTIMEFIMYLAVMLVFAILNLRLYYLEYGKETMIRLLHGNSYLKRYGAILYSEVFVHLVSCGCYFMLYQNVFSIVLMFIILLIDMTLYLLMIRLNEKKYFVRMLKGDQL